MHRTVLWSLALVVGMAGSALANPWDHVVHQTDRMRAASDGRGDRDVERSAVRVERTEQSSARAELRSQKPELPIRSEIRLKLSQGCGREDGTVSAKATGSAKSGSGERSMHTGKTGENRPMSTQERESLCKHTGVCMSGPASGDLEDKAE